MPRKKKYQPKSFESTGKSGDVSSNLYLSMLTSPAMQDLTARQFRLYVYMKAQLYGQKKKPEGKGETAFYFNKAKWDKLKEHSYKLYSSGADFKTDVKALESHGFIKTLENNWTVRERNIYELSNEWQNWKPPEKKTKKVTPRRKKPENPE